MSKFSFVVVVLLVFGGLCYCSPAKGQQVEEPVDAQCFAIIPGNPTRGGVCVKGTQCNPHVGVAIVSLIPLVATPYTHANNYVEHTYWECRSSELYDPSCDLDGRGITICKTWDCHAPGFIPVCNAGNMVGTDSSSVMSCD